MSNTTTTITNTAEPLRFLEDDFLQLSPMIETNKILISSNNNNLNINSDFEFIQEIDYSEIDSFFKNNNNNNNINININNQENRKLINSSSNNTIYELEPDEELTVDENDINFYEDEIKKPTEFNNNSYLNIDIPLPDLISDPVSDFSTDPLSADSENFDFNFSENIKNLKSNNNKDTNLFNTFIHSSSSSSNIGFRDINKMNIKIKKRSKSAVDIPIFNSDIQLRLLSDEKKIQIKDELISPILNKNLEFRKFKSSNNLSHKCDSNITTNTNTTATTTTTTNNTTTANTTTTTTTIALNPFYKPPAILRRLSEADGYKISKNYKKFNNRK
ncbi:unnamed protein product [[Candida] boidinii]|uniref:Unnamed protein product n=1 Tax=Candida boidinii TaxID=5477 RepID=A0A9W6WHR2_CANBO|nr:hypothetical protein B5S30_g3756 [[Candida] boidinii]GME73714.1 unnamed protein product [[Candida] boidinii]GMF57247.1 unnamed protein product [[Candida] boidinii]GMF98516.1 unnamed protein product [[Candida] boidinii]